MFVLSCFRICVLIFVLVVVFVMIFWNRFMLIVFEYEYVNSRLFGCSSLKLFRLMFLYVCVV